VTNVGEELQELALAASIDWVQAVVQTKLLAELLSMLNVKGPCDWI